MRQGNRSAPALPRTPIPPDARGVPLVETERLFGASQEIRIQHRGEEYRLRITRNQKLILTK